MSDTARPKTYVFSNVKNLICVFLGNALNMFDFVTRFMRTTDMSTTKTAKTALATYEELGFCVGGKYLVI